MKPTRTWILIADGARARILENDGPGRGLHSVPGAVFHGDHASTHAIVSDRAGRTHQSKGQERSAIEAHSDPHRELKKKFAHQLADALAQGLQQKSYDRLVIVAAPSALGDLRAALSENVRAKVTGEVAKDLTKTPDADVAGHPKDVVAI
jgi:protein required for attachment to host cells